MTQQQAKPGLKSVAELFAEGDKAVLTWTYSAASYDDLRIHDDHDDAETVQILSAALDRLKQDRDNAVALVSLLTSERKTLRTYITNLQSPDTSTHRLYAKVGLHEGCPDFLLRAARTAYRKALHPDGQPERYRAEAERRFVEAEAVFDEIWRLRRL